MKAGAHLFFNAFWLIPRYKLFRQTTPGKTATEINLLRSLSHRQNISIKLIISIMYIMCIMQFIPFINIIAFDFSLLDLFKTVFPYRNKVNRHIMDTEKVHSIKHGHVDVTNYANPINCCCDGPEGGHKTWVHQQGLRTNQGSSSAKTLMTHSLNKEASQLLCDAVRCRVEDGDATAENWMDSKGKALAPDRFWNVRIESFIAGDDEGPCKGIELNIWERTKVIFSYLYVFNFIIHIISIIHIILINLDSITGTSSHRAHIGGRRGPAWGL